MVAIGSSSIQRPAGSRAILRFQQDVGSIVIPLEPREGIAIGLAKRLKVRISFRRFREISIERNRFVQSPPRLIEVSKLRRITRQVEVDHRLLWMVFQRFG